MGQKSVGEEIVGEVSLFHVIGEWHSTHELWNQFSFGLEFNHFSEGGNSIISSMSELRSFGFLFFDSLWHWVIDCSHNSLYSTFINLGEGVTSSLGSHTNSINCSLSNGSKFVLGVSSNLLHNRNILWSKISWTKMFNHII
jgi:hypothetical protein